MSARIRLASTIAVVLLASPLGAQENSFSIGTLRTELARAAVRLAVESCAQRITNRSF